MTMSRKLWGSRTYAKTIGTSGKVTIGEVVTFPIKAHEAGDPAHLIAYSHMLQHDYIPAEEADKVVIPNSDEFCFLDIGVGIAAINPE